LYEKKLIITFVRGKERQGGPLQLFAEERNR